MVLRRVPPFSIVATILNPLYLQISLIALIAPWLWCMMMLKGQGVVDVDSEEVEFASEQIRYQGITAALNNEFNRMKSVLK